MRSDDFGAHQVVAADHALQPAFVALHQQHADAVALHELGRFGGQGGGGDVARAGVHHVARGQGAQVAPGFDQAAQIAVGEDADGAALRVSNDGQLLGQVAAKIRSFRKPEPYKGKGVKFVSEELRRKAGKSA